MSLSNFKPVDRYTLFETKMTPWTSNTVKEEVYSFMLDCMDLSDFAKYPGSSYLILDPWATNFEPVKMLASRILYVDPTANIDIKLVTPYFFYEKSFYRCILQEPKSKLRISIVLEGTFKDMLKHSYTRDPSSYNAVIGVSMPGAVNVAARTSKKVQEFGNSAEVYSIVKCLEACDMFSVATSSAYANTIGAQKVLERGGFTLELVKVSSYAGVVSGFRDGEESNVSK